MYLSVYMSVFLVLFICLFMYQKHRAVSGFIARLHIAHSISVLLATNEFVSTLFHGITLSFMDYYINSYLNIILCVFV